MEIINDDNFKTYTSKDIKKFVTDKDKRYKYLRWHTNKRYYLKVLKPDDKIIKHHCQICNKNICLLSRHNKSQQHIDNLNKINQ
jgi:hypothetical protein